VPEVGDDGQPSGQGLDVICLVLPIAGGACTGDRVFVPTRLRSSEFHIGLTDRDRGL